MLTDWVTGGGNLIAMHPDKQLAGLLGLTDAGSTLTNAYLLIDTSWYGGPVSSAKLSSSTAPPMLID